MQEITIHWEPSDSEISVADGPIKKINLKEIGRERPRMVAVNAQEVNRKQINIAGAYGYVQYGWFNLLSLWVSPDHRRRYIATELMKKIEDICRENNLIGVRLSTTDFSIGPMFYEKLGYTCTQKWVNRRAEALGGYWNEMVFAKWLIPIDKNGPT